MHSQDTRFDLSMVAVENVNLSFAEETMPQTAAPVTRENMLLRFAIWQSDMKAWSAQGKLTASRVADFLHEVELHFRKEHLPAFYAARLHISKDYLREICQKELSHSPTKVIQVRIISEALTILVKEYRPVNDITDELGFNDASHFIRFFKKHTGVSPALLRKSSGKPA